MSPSNAEVVDALRSAVKERDHLLRENRRLLTGATEPIAIVGMACRYPGGASSPAELWELVAEGRDAIGSFPSDRGWDLGHLYDPTTPDDLTTCSAHRAGFMEAATDFDPGFFGISPREALGMDPQQRLLLETSWQALEDAGIDPQTLAKTQTGVFTGVMYQDYGDLPGMQASVVPGRVAYVLGLQGPAMTVDTACSSSMVAMHLAAQALRRSECSLALAGGVTVLSSPGMLIHFSRQRALAPDGRSKSFSDLADGTGLAEGAGILALERLSDARRNGREILAILKGSAVNQDGASNGLTAPNGPSQERVIRQALANARLEARDVDAVEAHGTGTSLGDPIEAGALLATYGQEREEPLRLGSIKSNIGHTLAAAGVASVIKMVEAMRHGVLPRTLHVDVPNTHVDWEAGEIELLTEPQEWEANGRPRRAGVSSFGASGTNAHVILEEAPAPAVSEGAEGPEGADSPEAPAAPPLPNTLALPLSAKSEPALREAAANLAAHLTDNPDLDPRDVAFSLATTRALFEQRAVVSGESREELVAALSTFGRGEPAANATTGTARSGKLAYLFTGQGAQRPGMGKELYKASPLFAQALDQACEALDPHLDRPLKELLFATEGSKEAELLNRTEFTQPALFAIEVALYRLLEVVGPKPDYLCGHSIGELAAAHLAGVLSLEDAAKLICARGALMGALPGGGAMVAIEASEAEVAKAIAGKEAELSIAAVNGPASIVISGVEQAALEVQAHFEAQGNRTKRLVVSHAFHSPLIEPMLREFKQVAEGLEYFEPQIPILSNLTGEALSPEQAQDPAYWVAQVRGAVRFADSVATLASQGTTTYLELGPDPVLTAMATSCLEEGSEATLAPTLRSGRGEAEAIGGALASAHVSGATPDWAKLYPGAQRVALPTYPFQRERFWLSSSSGPTDAASIGQREIDHPLLSAALEDPATERLTLTGRLSLSTHPWLADHAVLDTVILPGTAFVELALSAGVQVGAEAIEELTLQAPLILTELGAVSLQVAVGVPDEEGRREISIHSRSEAQAEDGAGEWALHATGTLGAEAPPTPEPFGSWPPEGAEPIDTSDLYERLGEIGFQYGPAFQGVGAAWQEGEEIYAEVSLAEAQRSEAGGFALHPALLDSALHGALLGALAGEQEGGGLPFSWNGVSVAIAGASSLRARLRLGEEQLSLQLADHDNLPLAQVGALRTRPIAAAQLQGALATRRDLFELSWVEAQLPEGQETLDSLAILGSEEIGGLDAQPHPDLESLLEALSEEEPPQTILLDTRPWTSEGEDPVLASHQLAARGLEAIQALLAQERLAETRLAFLTEGALSPGEEESPDLPAATLAGLLRSAASEHPGRFALVDLDDSDASAQALPAALAAVAEEPQLALREGKALVARLTEAKGEEQQDGESQPLDPDRTILITGATGGLGALFARHLAERHGARHLLLVSRSGPEAKGATELQAELEELGAEVRIAACDVAERDQLQELLASIPTAHPLGAVIHAAGALEDGLIESMGSESLDRVFAPKADAAHHLHELTATSELSHFVAFSSIAGPLGGAGQANYAAANSFLDALAAKRRAQGLPATSIAWGLWERESAMTAKLGKADLARLQRSGITPIADAQGLDLFDAAIASASPQPLALPLSRAALRSQATAGTLPPIFSALVKASARRQGPQGQLATQLASLPEPERQEALLEALRAEVAAVLGHDSGAAIDPERAFKDLGFDSLAAVELRNRLAALTGASLQATAVFDYPSAAKLAAHLLERMGSGAAIKSALRAQASEEPIAIVGMACRYPGKVGSPAELWQLVTEGRDGISSFPSDRGWELGRLYDPDPEAGAERLTSYTREGGFLADCADFDPAFFGISPREALVMDPQQRLLLEASWQALEDAGIDPRALAQTQTGVFAGVMYQDYGEAPGMSQSLVSGRVAYSLGLEGPAVTVDTACSSSLVAMHWATQALSSGECSLALAGGVTVLATPSVFVEFSRQRGLAPDGRSKSFAEAADGVGWSEGVGVLALERLSDAERNGHPVLAILKGSAVNQDGASNGFSAPNGPSQERVIRQALANARLQASDVDAVEAHGTGTTLGDPIEAGALLATYGQDREEPLKLGSIKSNIGHTQAAAGVAGVIKMVEAMRHGVLPRTLHVDAPSSKVDWEAGEVELLTEPREWEPNDKPRRAGVSSFGISGTNAHVILEEAPAPAAVQGTDGAVPVEGGAGAESGAGSEGAEPPAPLPNTLALPLSAKSEPALRQAAANLATHLTEHPNLDPRDVAFSLATTRALFEQRAVVAGESREELVAALSAFGRGEPTAKLTEGKAQTGKLAYLFTGQGAQRPDMGAELYESSPLFAGALDEACEALDPHLERSLKELLFATEGSKEAELLNRTEFTQPALFAIELALFRLLEPLGPKPDYLCGHSIGELAAAHLAGVLSLEDAAKLICARGALMGALPEGGAMVAIEASEEEVEKAIVGKEAELSLAAVNGPASIVISGEEKAALEVQSQFEEQGNRTKRLTVSHAFHSPLIEPMLREFKQVAESLEYSEPQIPILSNLTGEVLSPEQAQDPAYWVAQVRGAVRFADSVTTLQDLGTTTYLELGPDPVLTAMATSCLPAGSEATLAPTLRSGRGEAEAIGGALASAHVSGAKLDWAGLYPGAQRVALPTYPFQRERFWLSASSGPTDASSIGQREIDHPLLSAALEDPATERLTLTGRLSLATHPWLADHAVLDTVILPGTAFVELALKAGQEVGAERIEELTLQAPLILSEQGAVSLQVAVGVPDDEGQREISIHSRAEAQAEEEAGEWTLHATGTLSAEEPVTPEPLSAWPPAGAEPIEVSDLYERLSEIGFQYGPAFQGVSAAWQQGEEIYAEVSLAEEQRPEAAGFALHPALLDSAFHAGLGVALAQAEAGEEAKPTLPFDWHGVRALDPGAASLRVRVSIAEGRLSLNATDSTGAAVFEIASLFGRPVEQAQLAARGAGRLYRLGWEELELEEQETPTELAILGSEEIGELGAERYPDLESLLEALPEENSPQTILLDARPWTTEGEDPVLASHTATVKGLEAIQALLAAERLAETRLAFLTEGALSPGEEESPDLPAATLAGLLRSAASEHPGRFALVDLDASDASAQALPAALAAVAEEPQLALREGKALVARLGEAKGDQGGSEGEQADGAEPAEGQPQPLDPEKTVLITGATGGLGALFARHLAERHGARQLLLVSRSGPEAKGASELQDELEELGAEVRIAACDVADRDQLQELLASIPTAHPLGAVIHAAGVFDNALITDLQPESLGKVMAPKADAAHHLHELSADSELSHFLLFSSAAGLLGGPGQGNYAAANSFLDALAAKRRAQGLAATSLAWGLWAQESNLAEAMSEAERERVLRQTRMLLGFEPIPPEQGLALFEDSFHRGDSLLAPVAFDRPALRAQAKAGTLPALMRALVRVPRGAERAGESLSTRLATVPVAEREAFVLDFVRGHVAAVLGHDSAAAIDPERAFKDLGFDSLAAVELRNRLVEATGVQLPASMAFDYPSAAALARHLLGAVSPSAAARSSVRAQASEEPIAIVGMSCRYPGAVASPDQLWRLVAEGKDGISEFPTDRGWDLGRLYDPDLEAGAERTTSYTREGGFLHDCADFDPAFFGISPREALAMDPQQRLLLEASWQALEDAGIDPRSLARSQTGVFAGVMYQDYGEAPGMSQSLVSGRVAYSLGLEGPALTVDTACSSSLVAMHLAAQALRSGECSLALAGGVTVLSTPGMFIYFSSQGGLAFDGRSKSFSEAADGVSLSEGVGVLALERLSEAERAGHPVLAVIRGSATNQDGASNGLTAPNGPSQERVIRQALANARLEPADVDAVEAHGTGTTLGDPIEAGALLATYGQEREEPLRLGSIKSNIGHTQAAAGVAGVIKMVEAMRHGVLPRTLHVDAPSSKVDWEAGEVELLTESREWEANDKPRRAGVSSFGISGTNAHVILEEAPAPAVSGDAEASASGEGPEATEPPTPPLPNTLALPLSAKSEPALRQAAANLATHLTEHPNLDPRDVAFSLATTRALFEQRAVVAGESREELVAALSAFGRGEPTAKLTEGKAQIGKLAYLFTGQGAQRPGMGKELYAASPLFAGALDQACEALDPHLARPLKELLFATEGSKEAELLNRTELTQPALFGIELALYRLLQATGLRPDYLCGHSIGELAAAHLAGVLSLKDAAKLICARGALMGALPEGGAMVAIEASEEEVSEAIAGKEAELSIAAVNGPASIVISGVEQAALEVQSHFEAQGNRTKRLTVSHAFHSPLIEPMLREFKQVAEGLEYSEPQIPILSNLTGEVLSPEQAQDPAYWVAQVRGAVRFADSVATLQDLGTTTYLELGPDPVLTAMATSCLPAGSEATLAPTLRSGRGEAEAIGGALASAHVSGAKLDWAGLYPGAQRVALPTYPFQRERFWLSASSGPTDASSIGQREIDHPLLSAALEDPATERLTLTGRLSLATHPWLADHAVLDTVILPGTAFVELALSAGAQVGAEAIEELTLQAPLILSEQGAVSLQVTVGVPDDQGQREISIHSRAEAQAEDGAGEWILHATGALSSEAPQAPEPFGAWPPEGAEPIDTSDLYERLDEIGFQYGPAFQGVSAAWRDGEEIYAEVSLAEAQRSEAGGFALHPALLDSALHGALLGALDADSEGGSGLPFSWNGVSVAITGASSLRVRLRATEEQLSLQLADHDNLPLAQVGALRTRPIAAAQLQGALATRRDLFELSWVEAQLPEEAESSPTELAILGTEEIEGLQAQPHPDLESLLEALSEEEPPQAILLDTRPWTSEGEDPVLASRTATAQGLEAIQALLAQERLAETRLAFLTEGALSPGEEESPDLPAATLAGLLRSAASEHPGRFALVDLDASDASAQALPAALAAVAEEPQLALREGRALVARLSDDRGHGALAPPAGPWRLDVTDRGTLDSLALVASPRCTEPLGPTEVRIAMRAAGLNFRDVLSALGLYPGEVSIGGEGAGVVLEVGSQVGDLVPGDRVMGMIPSAFAPLAISERDLIVPLPARQSFAQGASVPIAFMTAFFGLVDLAGLAAGEKVLIHAGAGGVGMAAVQLARHLGAEVFATASPSKWEALRAMGIEEDHIASSRDLEFKDKFLEVTHGEGLDVVLNALAGDFVDASLELLPGGGRFMEMGKTDIRDPEQISERFPGVLYRPFDLTEVEPERLQEMLNELGRLFESGALRDIPIVTWDLRRAPEAFRHLREGRNLGKVVLEVPPPLDPDRTILITGATGGLGALFARHLAERHGARHLLLVSRSGPEAKGATELRAELQELGAEVRIAACDVAERDQLQELLASIPTAHPLGAVIHAAGALEDGLIESMGSESLDRVFAPKADAAHHLHELTATSELSHFVAFSSIAGPLGGAGQANYAAANSFLDALAAKRRAQGLPATSIAWGLWERESAMTAKLGKADLARLQRSGITPIADAQGLDLFDAAIASASPQPLALPLSRAALRSQATAGTLPPIFSALVKASARRQGPQGQLATQLASLPEPERQEALLEALRAEVAAVLGHDSGAAIDPERAFKDLGFDSLAAVELRNRLAALTGASLQATAVFDYPSAAKLAAHLLERMGVASGGVQGAERQIDQLEAALSAASLAGGDRAELATRLRALAGSLEGGDHGELPPVERDRLEAATDDELLEAIDGMAGKA